jgi:glycogen debranching enzyme
MARDDGYYKCYITSPYFKENQFIKEEYENMDLPTYAEAKDVLPKPFWEGHNSTIECYNKAFEIAFSNLRKPKEGSGFVSNFIDTAFNGDLFMWDSVFILMFAKYGIRAFNFQNTLDNLYAKQHIDGFICRQIDESTGEDRFERFDATSTGPNILAWSEWEYYKNSKNTKRLEKVFPVLLSYHLWLKRYRTWQDGTYWSSGWGCGMDNQPRIIGAMEEICFDNGHNSWCDATMQQILSANILVNMAEIINRQKDVQVLKDEIEKLSNYVNHKMWDEETKFYYDTDRDGNHIKVKSIGAFWSIISGLAKDKKLKDMIAHLQNEDEFYTKHCVASLSKDHPDFSPEGSYWLGSVWAPTNYMVLKGLELEGYEELAHKIALNHVDNVVKVFENTNTLWENYAPEEIKQGSPSRANFVGWTGLPPVAVLFENVFGIRSDIENNRIIWDVRLCEAHGIERYPYSDKGIINLYCDTRDSLNQKPNIKINSNIPVEVEIKWAAGSEIIKVNGN